MTAAASGTETGERRRAQPYLLAIAIGWPASLLIEYFTAISLPAGSWNPTTISIFVVMVVVLVLWLFSTPGRPRDARLLAFVLAVAVLWVIWLARAMAGQPRLAVSVLFIPVLLFLIVAKPPDRRTAGRALAGFVWTFTAGLWCVVGAYVLDWGVLGNAVAPPVAPVAPQCGTFTWLQEALAQGAGDRVSLAARLGLSDAVWGDRWPGPFANPNILSPLAAFILVYGVSRRRLSRIVLVGSGAVFLLLTGTRTSLFAVAAALVVIFIQPGVLPRLPITRPVRLVGAAAVVVAGALFVYGRDPDLNGRTGLWSQLLPMWQAQPVWGIGDSGFTEAIDGCVLPSFAGHAHNIVYDALVRLGLVGLVAVLAVLGVSLWLSLRAARAGMWTSLALLTVLVVGGMLDVNIDWGAPTFRWVGFLLLPALLAWSWSSADDEPDAKAADDESGDRETISPS